MMTRITILLLTEKDSIVNANTDTLSTAIHAIPEEAALGCGLFRRTSIDRDLSTGATLREAREGTGRSYTYFARKLNIPERYLRAIEDENFPVLPGLVYEKHFVGRYALALKLDPEPFVERWVALREGEARPITRFVPRVRHRELWISPMALRRTTMAFVFLLMAAYVGSKLWIMVSPPALTVVSPTERQIVQEANLTINGQVPVDTVVTVNGQTVATTPAGVFAVPVTLDVGQNTIRVVAKRRFGRAATIERHVILTTERFLTQARSN